MGMPFDDCATGLQGHVIEGVRQLAKASAHIWNHASLTQFASRYKTAVARGAAQVFPETENVAGTNLQSVQLPRGEAQVLDLALLEEKLRRQNRLLQNGARLG